MLYEHKIALLLKQYYKYAEKSAQQHVEERLRVRYRQQAVRALYRAAQLYAEALKHPGLTAAYIDNYVSRKTGIVRQYSYYLSQVLRYQSTRHLARTAAQLNTCDIVMLTDEITAHTGSSDSATDTLVNTVLHELSTVVANDEHEANRLARAVIAAASRFIMIDLRFISLFRAVVPCAWCGREASLTSGGYDLRRTTIQSVPVRLPCCPDCTDSTNEIEVYNIVVGVLVYALCLEEYLSKLSEQPDLSKW